MNIRRTALTLVFICAWLANVAAQTNSLADAAASSKELRHQLISEYESNPGSFRDDRLLAAAISYSMENRTDRGKAVYQLFIKDHPENVRALRGLGLCYSNEGRFEEAIGVLSKAWSLGDRYSLVPLAAAYYASKQDRRMESLVPDLLKQKESDPDAVAQLLAYASSQEPVNEGLFLEAMNSLPDNEFLIRTDIAKLVAVAANRLKSDEMNNATLQAIFRKIIRGYLADTNSWPKSRLIAVGEAYSGLMKTAEAEVIYRQVLRDDPDNGTAMLGLGIVNLYQHRPAEAIKHLREALKRGQQDALRNLGAAYVMSKDYSGMKDLVPALVERKRENREILNTLIIYAFNTEPPDKALFYQAIEGLTDSEIVRREDTANAVILGLKQFGDEQRARHLLELQAKHKRGVGA